MPQKFNGDLTDPAQRKLAERFVYWTDHGVLRGLWHNFSMIAPGAYRSNHPDHKRFAAYAAQGIKTILNLRGAGKGAPYVLEAESCAAVGLDLVSVQLSARRAPKKVNLLELFEAFETMQRPFLIHCKSGADRTGLAGALYLMTQEGVPLEQARRQLSFRYLHIKRSSTGILDHFLDAYAARNAQSPIDIITWVKTEYDKHALTESFAAKRAALKPWQGWF